MALGAKDNPHLNHWGLTGHHWLIGAGPSFLAFPGSEREYCSLVKHQVCAGPGQSWLPPHGAYEALHDQEHEVPILFSLTQAESSFLDVRNFFQRNLSQSRGGSHGLDSLFRVGLYSLLTVLFPAQDTLTFTLGESLACFNNNGTRIGGKEAKFSPQVPQEFTRHVTWPLEFQSSSLKWVF